MAIKVLCKHLATTEEKQILKSSITIIFLIALTIQSGPQPELDIKFPAISFANRLNQNIGLTA